MSLVNQVLRDLQKRSTETADTSGLAAATAAPSSARGQRYWLLGGLAVVVGIGLFALESVFIRGEPEAVAATEPPPVVRAVPDRVPEPDPQPEPVAELDAPIEPLIVATVTEPEPETAPEPETGPARSERESATVPAPPPQAPRDEGTQRRTLVATSPQERAADAYAAGVRALADGRRGTAETRFRTALGHDASHHDARLALANLLGSDGRVREAEGHLLEGLRIAPQHAPLAERYARMLFDRGDVGGALGVLQASPPDVESAPDYHALLAALLQRAGHHDDAADTYGRLVSIRPDHGVWWMGLGISLEGSGRQDAAVDAYARAARDPRLSGDVARFVRERIATLDQGRTP